MRIDRNTAITATSIRLIRSFSWHWIHLTTIETKRQIFVTLEPSIREFATDLHYKLCPHFCSKIDTMGRNEWLASFNNRRLSIRTIGGDGLSVMDTDTYEFIVGSELRSVKNFLEWHVKSRRVSSEVARIWTTP